jgi:hypothetical protein
MLLVIYYAAMPAHNTSSGVKDTNQGEERRFHPSHIARKNPRVTHRKLVGKE